MKTELHNLEIGDKFKLPDGRKEGYLLHKNNSRARVSIGKKSIIINDKVVFQSEIIQDWSLMTEVVKIGGNYNGKDKGENNSERVRSIEKSIKGKN